MKSNGKVFNYKIADAQATEVKAISCHNFDFDRYVDYELSRQERCRKFWESDSGVLVYRRVRAAEVFSYGCQDMKNSLELQLGALEKSLEYEADIPNFLEPWYGIGTIASAFGVEYVWNENQAPAFHPRFASTDEALDYDVQEVSKTTIGQHTLDMIDYFLDATKGKLPVSLTDIQSPLNIACGIADINQIFMDLMDKPDMVESLLSNLASLIAEFSCEQQKRIGQSLVLPGHGFASSRCFKGLGMSDDNAVMISPAILKDIVFPNYKICGAGFSGIAFHSCGNWVEKIHAVKEIDKLTMVDGAFSPETDPGFNKTEKFREGFANTDIVVNMRLVGSSDVIVENVRKIWKPGMKLIVTTYCPTSEEQSELYGLIHDICK